MILRELQGTDRAQLETMLRQTPAFREADVKVALELISDRLEKGAGSDYQFIVAAEGQVALGYACYGLIPLTLDSFDLYWIVVAPDKRDKRVGIRLLEGVSQEVIRRGGARIYVDTSSADAYTRARAFYSAKGFVEKARLSDFYRKGEAKVIYCLELPAIGRKPETA